MNGAQQTYFHYVLVLEIYYCDKPKNKSVHVCMTHFKMKYSIQNVSDT